MSTANIQPGSNLDVLLDIELPVTLRFGRTQIPLLDVIGFGTGSVVDFGVGANDPVEVMVNGRVVARGEAVMVQGNYGVRIVEIEKRGEPMVSTPARVDASMGPAPGAK
jgi:flagellar motor switch protein FliN/FliY